MIEPGICQESLGNAHDVVGFIVRALVGRAELAGTSAASGLTLETWEDRAWIGVVPFLMSRVTPRCCPPIPKLSRFLELNVRTYVSLDGKPGVWFFSLDAANRIAVRVARATFNLPYMDASMSMERDALANRL